MADCQVESELENCGKFDIYTMQMPACNEIGCPTLATGLWFFALLSLGLTIAWAWTAAFYTRTMQNRLVLQQQQWRVRGMVFMTVLGILMLIIFSIGWMGGTSSVLIEAILNPLLPLAAWLLALAITFAPGAEEEAIVTKAAALEIPCFNALMALHLNLGRSRNISTLLLQAIHIYVHSQGPVTKSRNCKRSGDLSTPVYGWSRTSRSL